MDPFTILLLVTLHSTKCTDLSESNTIVQIYATSGYILRNALLTECSSASTVHRTYTNLDSMSAIDLGYMVQPTVPRLKLCMACYCKNNVT